MNFRKFKRRFKEMKEIFAAIDLGTNSCRLLVAKFDGQLRITDSYSKVVRLGENLPQNGSLSEEAMERTMKALKICCDKIAQNNVTHLRAVTTEACRRASNGKDLVQRVKDELNLEMEIIGTEEEALLALSGCVGVFQRHIPYVLAFDIGGGSTEIMWVKLKEEIPSFEIIDCISIPFGVVTLSDAYASHATSPVIYEQIREKIRDELVTFSEKHNIQSFIDKSEVQMIGTSGTVTTLAAIFLKLNRYDRYLVDGIFLQTSNLHEVAQEILKMPTKERNNHPCIGAGRTDLVITGSAILEGILDAFPTKWMRVADRGVREGILMNLVQEVQKEYAQSA